jgi:Kef-type K+ transport system membrane component KefB
LIHRSFGAIFQLILAGVLGLGFVLDFAWPAEVMPRAAALAIGILVAIGAIGVSLLAVREMVRAKTALNQLMRIALLLTPLTRH